MSVHLDAGRVLLDEPVDLAVVDYGMGNRRSVEKALERIGARVAVTSDPERLRAAEGLVLPGVGAFPKGMESLRALGLDQFLRERVAAGTPLLGICLGLQLAFERSTEQAGADGLGIVAGEVRPLATTGGSEGATAGAGAAAEGGEAAGAGEAAGTGAAADAGEPAQKLKLPHIGWNETTLRRPSPLWEGLPERCAFYHVHSFAPVPANEQDVVATAVYGAPFVTAVERGSFCGVQFHPEKSSAAGLRLLANFARICSRASARQGAAHTPPLLGDPAPR